MRIFRDPSWQFIAVVVAAIVGIIVIYLTLVERPYKGLQVEVLSNSPVVSVNADLANEIEVLYKGQPVHALSLILLKIENTGNEPITENDYSEPISISISQNAQVGEVSVQETSPDGIPLTPLVTSSNQIELSKVLLNPGDQAIVKILAVNNDGSLGIEGRIAGITEIEKITGLQESNASQPSSSTSIFLPSLALVFGVLAFIFAIVSIPHIRWLIEWRKRHFGFDPAAAYYRSAQDYILTGKISEAILALKRAFSWDGNYAEKSQTNSIFSSIQDYEPYIALINKYKLPQSQTNQVPTTPTAVDANTTQI